MEANVHAKYKAIKLGSAVYSICALPLLRWEPLLWNVDPHLPFAVPMPKRCYHFFCVFTVQVNLFIWQHRYTNNCRLPTPLLFAMYSR